MIPEYDVFIERAANHYKIDPLIVKAMIMQESSFNPRALSSKGALGLMQLMPGTAKDMGVVDITDPEQNIMGGVKYLRKQLDRFRSLDLALAAYNAGPGNVKKYQGIPPFRETQDYIKKVNKNLKKLRHSKFWGV